MSEVKTILCIQFGSEPTPALPKAFQSPPNKIVTLSTLKSRPCDIYCQLNDIALLPPEEFDGIWMPRGFNTLMEHKSLPFLKDIYKSLRPNGDLLLTVPNIKEVSRIAYQNSLSKPLPQIKLTPHDLLFGYHKDIEEQGQSYQVKQGFTPAKLETLLKASPFSKSEIFEQGFSFTIKAHKSLQSVVEKKILFFGQDINDRIAQRDRLDQATQLPVQYP